MTTITPPPSRTAIRGGDVGTRPGASDTDEPTGPMPVVDLAGGHLHISVRRDVLVLAVDGGLDDDLASMLAPAIERAVDGAAAAVLDLDQVTLLDRSGLEAICDAFDGGGDGGDPTTRCLVAGRLSGRLVLDRWEIPERYAVFTSVPDALQARAFIESGYGNGWMLEDPDA